MSPTRYDKKMAYRGIAFLLAALALMTIGFATLWFNAIAIAVLALFWLVVVGLIVDLSRRGEDLDSERW